MKMQHTLKGRLSIFNRYPMVCAGALLVSSVACSYSQSWVFDTVLANNVQVTSTYDYDVAPWHIHGSTTGNMSVSAGGNTLSVSGSASANSSITYDEAPLNGGNNQYSYVDAVGSARWRYTGKPGDAPALTVKNQTVNVSGAISIGGSAYHTDGAALSSAEAFERASAGAATTTSGSAQVTTNGFTSASATLSQQTFTFTTGSLGYSYSGSANYSISASTGSYQTGAGIGTVTANCEIKCEADAHFWALAQYRAWGGASASASGTGSATVRMDL